MAEHSQPSECGRESRMCNNVVHADCTTATKVNTHTRTRTLPIEVANRQFDMRVTYDPAFDSIVPHVPVLLYIYIFILGVLRIHCYTSRTRCRAHARSLLCVHFIHQNLSTIIRYLSFAHWFIRSFRWQTTNARDEHHVNNNNNNDDDLHSPCHATPRHST